jgi:hypothetical protein
MSARVTSGLDIAASELVIAAPGSGDGYWAGGPSAWWHDGVFYLAYRLRRPVDSGRGYANVVARSTNGVTFETLCSVDKDVLDTASLERPALVRRPDGGWRLFVSLSTPGSKHWRIDCLDADDPAELATGTRTVVWPGDADTAVKDPVVLIDADGGWHAWICCHPLTEPGEEDRMTTRYASSADGLQWTWGETVLEPGAAGWDRRGRRVATVLQQPDGAVQVYYDGRADAAENWYERTGLATGESVGSVLTVAGDAPVAQSDHSRHTLRYASAVQLPAGTARIYFEAANETGANEIRTQLISSSIAD